jgi:hypothetical protein
MSILTPDLNEIIHAVRQERYLKKSEAKALADALETAAWQLEQIAFLSSGLGASGSPGVACVAWERLDKEVTLSLSETDIPTEDA